MFVEGEKGIGNTEAGARAGLMTGLLESVHHVLNGRSLADCIVKGRIVNGRIVKGTDDCDTSSSVDTQAALNGSGVTESEPTDSRASGFEPSGSDINGSEPTDSAAGGSAAGASPSNGSAVVQGADSTSSAIDQADSLASIDPASLDDDDLAASVLLIEDIRRSLDSLSLNLLSELDSRGTTDVKKGMRTGSWLAHESQQSTGSCRARVKVSKMLRGRLDAAGGALRDGRIGYQHAQVFADVANRRIIDDFNLMIPHLISLIPLMSFAAWKREVAGVAALLDADGGHKPGDDIEDSKLSLSAGLDGVLGIHGQLTGDGAVIVSQAMRERADRLFHQMKRDAELTRDLVVPPRQTLLALALVELVREALAKDATSSQPAQPEVSLVINASDPTLVTDDQGVPIGDTTRSTLLCDPIFKPVVMGVEGTVLDLGRDQRLASKALRRALAHRDGGCVWPGCDRPATWCDAHHVKHWEHGGATDRENMGSLCRYHHGVTHRKGWAMHQTKDEWFWWQTPSGDTFWSQRHGRIRSGPPPDPTSPPEPTGLAVTIDTTRPPDPPDTTGPPDPPDTTGPPGCRGDQASP